MNFTLPSGVERYEIESREHWHALRRKDITASVIGCLLGVHEYTTAYEQHHLKAGTITADPEQTAAMERGELLEPVAAELTRRRHPDWIVQYPIRAYYSDRVSRIGCTPDLFVLDPSREGFGAIQIKSVEATVFRRKWRHDDSGTRVVEPPTWIVVQAITEAMLTGASWAAVAPLVVSHGLDMPIIEVPIHVGIWTRLRELSAEFWDGVETGRPPSPDFGRDGAIIAAMHDGGNGETIDLSGSNKLPAILEQREHLQDQIKIAKERCDEIKAELIHALGKATFGRLPGWMISNKVQTRKAHHVKESTFTVLRASRA